MAHQATFAALADLDASLARGQAAAGIVRKPVEPIVPAWAFNALAADVLALRAAVSGPYAHDEMLDQ